jgi:hypothetical protein
MDSAAGRLIPARVEAISNIARKFLTGLLNRKKGSDSSVRLWGILVLYFEYSRIIELM